MKILVRYKKDDKGFVNDGWLVDFQEFTDLNDYSQRWIYGVIVTKGKQIKIIKIDNIISIDREYELPKKEIQND